jgi:cysteine-rich secretory family protein
MLHATLPDIVSVSGIANLKTVARLVVTIGPSAGMMAGQTHVPFMIISLRMSAALCVALAWSGLCYADCASLHVLAQQHANDMARRNSLDHAGFMSRRGPAGVVAENVATGCETEACARRMWMQSSPHRRNMMLGGCQGVASAVSASGRRYWAMEIGGDNSTGRGHGRVTRASAARAGRSLDGIVGRDFSVDGINAP